MKAEDLWQEFIVNVNYSGISVPMCGLCGNHGFIDTTLYVKTPAGYSCGIKAPCICPNGRSIKHQRERKPG